MADEVLEGLVLDFVGKYRRACRMREGLIDQARITMRDMVGEFLAWDAETVRAERAYDAVQEHRANVESGGPA